MKSKKTLEQMLSSQKDPAPELDASHERVATSVARQKQSSLIDWVTEEEKPVVLTNKGTDEVAMISLSDLRLLDLVKQIGITAEDAQDTEALFEKLKKVAQTKRK